MLRRRGELRAAPALDWERCPCAAGAAAALQAADKARRRLGKLRQQEGSDFSRLQPGAWAQIQGRLPSSSQLLLISQRIACANGPSGAKRA